MKILDTKQKFYHFTAQFNSLLASTDVATLLTQFCLKLSQTL